jgi:hypothetical protein
VPCFQLPHTIQRHFACSPQEMLGKKPLDESGIRAYLAKRIMKAADSGVRDPRRLKLIAIGAIDA